MEKQNITTGLIFIFFAIVLGAFAAHGLENRGVSPVKISSFETGVRYLFYNGLGMLVLGALEDKFNFSLKTIYRLMFVGTFLFSVSIFLLVLLPLINVSIQQFVGPITPIGGGIMILSWFILLVKYIASTVKA